ncbi:MAG: hydroxymethylbilane synthase [Hyphomicrobium zavarzinii]|uniref:hydroxymethylbilane synthase n=1 Tax=Hyphomicrobium zavarzinii TaxID=48292 RepID=UPI001A4ACDE4|nr:hydroxymethylbilane synthase [Hyphomicrobium zavarzinii]MBL8844889.1 hydroxymethylbilane synthase [Hyphomicrobium zavarzinii]
MQARTYRIGTRGSPLALAQAHEVRGRLMSAHRLPEDAFEIRTYKTTGDIIVDRPLAEFGGKGLFTKELQEALLSDEIDFAVHSMKDMQTQLPDGLGIAAVLPREDVRDAFLSLKYASLDALPQGAVVGTSSLRRQAQVQRVRPDLKVVAFRGNVQTRLRKLAEGVADATLLACAGLKRLGLADRITSEIPVDHILPAVAQGAIAIEMRSDNAEIGQILAPLNDETTAIRVTAERAFLRRLEGSCRTPIAGLAELRGDRLSFRGMTFSLDGSECFSTAIEGPAGDAAALGIAAADTLLKQGAHAHVNRAP